MRSIALFVDAGYYFAGASTLLFGEKVARRELLCQHERLVDELSDLACDDCGDDEPVRMLRCYWYDGAPEGVPTPQHLEVSHLRNVKLRLGRLAAGGQKGVDGLIILDLFRLARERAIDTAFLLSGDEDLREAVVAAQQLGVRVVLLGIPPSSGSR